MDNEFQQVSCLVKIRAVVGDPYGRLMQDELVAHVAKLAAVERAAQRLCAAKGRHNTQAAYCDLADLLRYPSHRPSGSTRHG